MIDPLLYGWMSGFVVVLGLLLGSFLNVCIARMPEDRSIVTPPSHCPACGSGIRPWDNIPVLSWVLLRARCRDCGTAISSLYPTIELLTGLLAWLLWRRLVPDGDAMDPGNITAFGVALVFVCMLITQAYIDIRHFIIPDSLSVYAVPLGIMAAVLQESMGVVDAPTWQQSVVGAVAGAGSLGLVMVVFWLVRRREGMGMGDVKLLAMIGAFLGAWPAVPFVIFVSSVIGAAVGLPMALLRKNSLGMALPYGPFLALAAILWLLHGPELVELWYPTRPPDPHPGFQ